jgi:hypothetical protein
MEIYDPAEAVDPEEAREAELAAYKADMKRRGFCLDELTISPESLGFDGYLELAIEYGVTEPRPAATYDDAAPKAIETVRRLALEAAPAEQQRRPTVNVSYLVP